MVYISATGEALRRRLCHPAWFRDFTVLAECAAAGVTDYFAAPLHFADGECHVATFTTRQDGGFTNRNLADLGRVLPALARVAEVRAPRRAAANLLDAYVGRDADEKIVAGRIHRGDADTRCAEIWLSDMRGFAKLTDSAPPKRVIERLNAFFIASRRRSSGPMARFSN